MSCGLYGTPSLSSKPIIIAGIGASAGGLEALESFFKAMPLDSGMAFVVIQHLAPDYKSMMVELLSRKTDIPVLRAEDGAVVEPNHIYLIPPKKNLTIFHGKLLLTNHTQREGINLPVDIFLKSLAEDQCENAVGVILSGTGSDGTRGVRAIKEWGGLVMVQDEASAKFDGMPRAAASTGVADFVLPPSEMPAQLVACIKHPYASNRERQAQNFSNETGLTRLFSLLRARTKVDFTYYKSSTTHRRIERRIAVTQAPDLDSYVRYMENTPAEISALYRELLIGVTSFFRDSEVMELVRDKVLPEVLGRWNEQELRFWVAGCSTGEEAYSLAILAREVMENLGVALDLKIFATDIDRDAVAKAGTGVYPESIAADLPAQYLAKYFYFRGETYQVNRSIREMVVFAQHNLVRDPPFTRIDLVSCRNLLIYLQPNLQHRALEMFNFSLQNQGFLVLGNSETVGDMEDCFQPVNRKARIYRSAGKGAALSGAQAPAAPPHAAAGLSWPGPGQPYATRSTVREHDRVINRLLDALAAFYVPLAVVVNQQLEIIFSMGDPRGIFNLPRGRAVFDITKMVNRELAIPLSTGIQKTFRTGEELVYTQARLFDGADRRNMRLRICPLPGRKSDEAYVAVFFERIEKVQAQSENEATEYNLDEYTSQHLQDLEQELQFTRENLQATIEELETSNEELQATNEELFASNEELQSTNEELQSTNEELYTVNSELQSKIMELTEVQNDVQNLMSSSQIGTLILDEDLCIRKYSPHAAGVFDLTERDLGRPLNHLANKFADFDPVAKSLEVQRDAKPVERNVRAEDGRRYLVRILPYHVGPHTFSGVVITLIDITRMEEVRERLKETQRTAEDLVRHMPAGLFVYQVNRAGELILESGNQAAEKITGLKVEQHLGSRYTDLWPGKQGTRLQETFLEVFNRGEPIYYPEMDYSDQRFSGVFQVHVFPLPGKRLGVSFEDITERKRAEQAIKESKRFAAGTIEALSAHVCVLDESGAMIAFNNSWREFARANGVAPDDACEGADYFGIMGDCMGMDADHVSKFSQGLNSVLSGARPVFTLEYPGSSMDQELWFEARVTSFPGEGPVRVVVVHQNITERKLAGAKLENSEQRFRSLYQLLADAEETAQMGSWTWEVGTDTVTWSDNLFRLLKRDPALGAPSFAEHDPLYTPDSISRLREAVTNTLNNGMPYEIELDAICGDGSKMHCVARGKAEKDAAGVIRRLYGSLQEVS